VLSEAATQTSTQFLIGFETEFIFLRVKGDDRLVPGNDHPWCDSRAMLTGSPEAQALEGIVEILEDAGICVEMFHAEAAAGQVRVYRRLMQYLIDHDRSSMRL
jgi:glutamine synthetase